MTELARRAWHEPAVLIGLLVSVAVLVMDIAAGVKLDAEAIIAVLAPLLAALGIRETVTPRTDRNHREDP